MKSVHTRDITFELELDVTIAQAWKCWTESKELEKWLTIMARVDPRLGGGYELFWDPTNHNDNSTLGCKITSYVPNQVLSFEWRGPVPFATIMNVEPVPTWVVVSFEALSADKSLIHFRHSGWLESKVWQEARDWQSNAWMGAFEELKMMFNKSVSF